MTGENLAEIIRPGAAYHFQLLLLDLLFYYLILLFILLLDIFGFIIFIQPICKKASQKSHFCFAKNELF